MATIVRPNGRHSVLITGAAWITAVAIVGYKCVVGLAFTVTTQSLLWSETACHLNLNHLFLVLVMVCRYSVSVRAKNLRRRTIADLNVESFGCRSAALNTYRHPFSSSSRDFDPAIASSKVA